MEEKNETIVEMKETTKTPWWLMIKCSYCGEHSSKMYIMSNNGLAKCEKHIVIRY